MVDSTADFGEIRVLSTLSYRLTRNPALRDTEQGWHPATPKHTQQKEQARERKSSSGLLLFGVADGARTRDTQDHNLVLYQLNYSHHCCREAARTILTQNGFFTKTAGRPRWPRAARLWLVRWRGLVQTLRGGSKPAPGWIPRCPQAPDAPTLFRAG